MTLNIYEKIIKVMESVQYLEKDDEVGKGTTSAYRAISDEKVKRALRTAMIENKLVMIRTNIETEVTSREYKQFNQYSKADNKYEDKIQYFTKVKSTYKIINAENPEETEFIQSIGHGVDSQDKSAGKAMTYASKYALLDTYIIPTGDDPDKIHSNDIDTPITPPNAKNDTKKPLSTEKGTNTPVEYATAETAIEISSLVALTGSDHQLILDAYKVDTYNKLTKSQAEQVIRKLNKTAEEKGRKIEVKQ